MLGEGLRTEHKTSVSDVVSAADHAAEELIADRLRAARPGDGIVGEEGTAQSGERTWFVDPVDGTYNFLSGLPEWCAALALADADGPVLGAVYQPTVDELWLGGRDRATTRNGVPVQPLADRALDQVSIASYLHPTTLPDDRPARAAAARDARCGHRAHARLGLDRARLGGRGAPRRLGADRLPAVGLAAGRRAGAGRRWAAEVVEAHGHRWHLAGSHQVVAELAELVTTA